MDTSTLVMMAAALVMLAALLLAGLFQGIVPKELIVRWMGHGAGFRGILVGMTLGGITPGGPMTRSPVIASFYKMGVGVGPLVAYLTAWSLFGMQRIIMWEIPFLGPKVVMLRFAVSFFFPLIAGWLCELLWNKIDI